MTLNEKQGQHLKYMPYAFTEQGVAMLSSVLRSQTAIEVNIQIMRAFVSMRHFMVNNASVFSRLETMEYHQLEILQHQQDTDKHIEATNKRIGEVFRRLDEGNAKPNMEELFRYYWGEYYYSSYRILLAGSFYPFRRSVAVGSGRMAPKVYSVLSIQFFSRYLPF